MRPRFGVMAAASILACGDGAPPSLEDHGATAECYRSASSVLLGPRTPAGQQGQGPGWLRLERWPRGDSGAAELVDANSGRLGATWRRLAGDSVHVVGFDDFLRVELRLRSAEGQLAGPARSHSDAALEQDSTGRLVDLRRAWAMTASRAPCDSVPSRAPVPGPDAP